MSKNSFNLSRLFSGLSFARSLFPILFAIWISPSTSVIAQQPEAQKILSTIVDRENLPYSSEKLKPPGLDVEIGREIARRLGAHLDVRWEDTLEEGVLGSLLKPHSAIDLEVGIPIDFRTVEDSGPVGEKVLYSLPYTSARYVLVTKKTVPEIASFDDIKEREIVAEVGSVAAIDLSHAGYHVKTSGSQEKILTGLAAGEIEFGILWPNAGWQIDQNPAFKEGLKIQAVRCPVSGLEWNVGIAVAHSKRELLPQIDGAIVAMKKENWFKQIFEKYRIPYFGPFDAQGKNDP